MCLSVSDGSLLPVFAHMLGAKKVFYFNNVGTKCTFTNQIPSDSLIFLFILLASA